MRKRKTAAFVRPPRKRLATDAEVLAALREGLDRMPERTPEQEARAKKARARFDRWWDEGRAAWDALTAEERQREADRMLADIRRYDREADDRDLGPDGGRDMFGMLVACDREEARRAKRAAKRPTVDIYAAHAAMHTRTAVPEAVRAAPATEEATATDTPPDPPKKRRERFEMRVIEPALYDNDDDDDWGWS